MNRVWKTWKFKTFSNEGQVKENINFDKIFEKSGENRTIALEKSGKNISGGNLGKPFQDFLREYISQSGFPNTSAETSICIIPSPFPGNLPSGSKWGVKAWAAESAWPFYSIQYQTRLWPPLSANGICSTEGSHHSRACAIPEARVKAGTEGLSVKSFLLSKLVSKKGFEMEGAIFFKLGSRAKPPIGESRLPRTGSQPGNWTAAIVLCLSFPVNCLLKVMHSLFADWTRLNVSVFFQTNRTASQLF